MDYLKGVGIDKIPTAELEARVYDVIREMDDLKLKLETAEGIARASKEYSDPVWYAKTKYNLRMKGREHQYLMVEIAQRKKAERAKPENSINWAFVKVSARRLEKDLFDEIMNEAKQEVTA